jgi:hypothetical protein
MHLEAKIGTFLTIAILSNFKVSGTIIILIPLKASDIDILIGNKDITCKFLKVLKVLMIILSENFNWRTFYHGFLN